MLVWAADASMLRAIRKGSRKGSVRASDVIESDIWRSGGELLANAGEERSRPEAIRVVRRQAGLALRVGDDAPRLLVVRVERRVHRDRHHLRRLDERGDRLVRADVLA